VSAEPSTQYDTEAAQRAPLDEGITACCGAFSRDWVARLRDDVDAPSRRRERARVARSDAAREDFDHGMFPPRARYPEFESLAVRKYPQVGDISARSALTLHRGTANRSPVSRPSSSSASTPRAPGTTSTTTRRHA